MHDMQCVRLAHVMHGETVLCMHVRDMGFVTCDVCAWRTSCTVRPWHYHVCLYMAWNSRHAMCALGARHARRGRGIIMYACTWHGIYDMLYVCLAHVMHGEAVAL